MKLLFKNATVHPITSDSFIGDVLIENEIIVEVSKNIECTDAELVDCTGKHIFPGFIDAHSHIGLTEGGLPSDGTYQDVNEMTDPITAQVRITDGFNPDDEAIKEALSGGVTTVCVFPGSANLVGGQGAILKFKGITVEQMTVKNPSGLKMALGENPKRVYGSMKKMPSTRLGNAALIRSYFTKVKSYMAKKDSTEKEGKEFTDIDLNLEIGIKVLKKEIPARIHAHRKDDILTAIRLSEEFDFDLVVEHATESYKIADIIKEKNIPVVLGPIFGYRSKPELRDKTFDAIRIINEKGINAALMCDHPVIPQEYAIVQAGIALKYGAKEEDILKMLTINAAQILDLEDKIGSLEKGKQADIVIWTDHPLTYKATVEKVYIEGTQVY